MNAETKTLSIDYFLYSCLEHENTRKHLPPRKENRWPGALKCEEDEAVPGEIADKPMEELFHQIMGWYSKEWPELATQSPLDLETLPGLLPPFLLLCRDLEIVIKAKYKGEVPPWSVGNLSEEGRAFWEHLENSIARQFQEHKSFFTRYLQWIHGADREIEFEPGSRPPVGRFAPYFRRSTTSFPGGESRKRGPASGGGRRDGNRDRGGRGGDRDRNGNNRDRGGRGGDRDRNGNNRDRGGRDRNGNNRGRGRGGPPKKDPAQERESLREVLQAVQSLNENQDIQEVPLAPANSYYRRLQHQQIKDEGLASISRGEGQERSVVVIRPEAK